MLSFNVQLSSAFINPYCHNMYLSFIIIEKIDVQ